MIAIQRLQPKDDQLWNSYVRSHPEGTPFHLTHWRDAVENGLSHAGCYFMARQAGAVCGVLPLTHVKSVLFGNVLSSVGFAAYGGPLAESEYVRDELLTAARNEAERIGADYVELKWKTDQREDLPTNDLYVTFIKELSADHEENLMAIPRKQRAMVRKGIKSGLRVCTGHDLLDRFYEIFAINVHRLGTPVYGKKWFVALLDAFGKDAEIQVVKYEDRVIAAVFTLYYGDTVLPYYAGSLMEYRKHAPNDFQYWMLMKRAVEKGCRFFDYGRSKKGTGQFSFKKHWGFTPQQLHYKYILNKADEVPAVNPLNPKYQRKIQAWKKLPLPVTKILGPRIVRNIP